MEMIQAALATIIIGAFAVGAFLMNEAERKDRRK
jgi:hypothetical protein